MAAEIDQILQTAQDALDRQESELQALRARQILSVVVVVATGSGDLGELFQLDAPFRLIFLRCHYTGMIVIARWSSCRWRGVLLQPRAAER